MYHLTTSASALAALTATAVVIGLVAVFAIKFMTQIATNILGNL
jgi:hypothetical protein